MKKKKILVTGLIILAIAMSFGLPKTKYRPLGTLKKICIPFDSDLWKSKDISYLLNLNDKRYNFVGDAFARLYSNKNGQSLLFLVLDAGNFHNPKVCFRGSGYEVKELNDTEFKIGNRSLKAPTIFAKKGSDAAVIVYWLCIDKKKATWGQQKMIEFWSSFMNRQKSAFMVRLEMPSEEKNIPNSLKLAKNFLEDLSKGLSVEESGYLFGE